MDLSAAWKAFSWNLVGHGLHGSIGVFDEFRMDRLIEQRLLLQTMCFRNYFMFSPEKKTSKTQMIPVKFNIRILPKKGYGFPK